MVKQASCQRRVYGDDGIFVLNTDDWNEEDALDDEDENDEDGLVECDVGGVRYRAWDLNFHNLSFSSFSASSSFL